MANEHPVRSQTPMREYFEEIRDLAAGTDGRRCMTTAAIIKRWCDEAIATLDAAPEMGGGLESDRFRLINDPLEARELEEGDDA